MIDQIYRFILYVHILGGSIGLITGVLVFTLKKGTQTHRKLGRVFIWGMLGAGFSSSVLALIKPNTFLLLIGIFTVYMIGTGASAVFARSANPPLIRDRVLQGFMVLSGIVLVGLGVTRLYQAIAVSNSGLFFGLVYLVFGGIGLGMVSEDLGWKKSKNQDSKAYLRKHIGRLGGGFIAAMTAFLVVTLSLPDWVPTLVPWLAPTVLITPLLVYWIQRHKK